jgi:hypothetical protein
MIVDLLTRSASTPAGLLCHGLRAVPRVLVALVLFCFGTVAALAQSDTARSIIFVYIPDQVLVRFATDLDLRTFFASARYDSAENAYIGLICISGRTAAEISFGDRGKEQIIGLNYDGRVIEATARILDDLSDAGDAALVSAPGTDAGLFCPDGERPVRLAIYLPDHERDLDPLRFSGTIVLQIRPV